jgi:hypothetical protein
MTEQWNNRQTGRQADPQGEKGGAQGVCYLESHDGAEVLCDRGEDEEDEVMDEQHRVMFYDTAEAALNDVHVRVVEHSAHQHKVLPASSSFL